MRPIFMYKVQLLVLHQNQETLEKEKGLTKRKITTTPLYQRF